MKAIRVLIVDDQKLFATSLEGILKEIGGDRITATAIAFDGEDALRQAATFRPDLVLLDIFMPGMSGLEALKALRANHPEVKVLMLTTFGYQDYIAEAVAGGASGYVLKDTTPGEVWEAIVGACEGRRILSPAVVDVLAGKGRAMNASRSPVPPWLSLMSEKERKILLYLAKGYSNDEIAEKVHLGKHTVRNYISSIYEKLEVKDRFEAMRKAIEAQIHTLVIE